MWLQGEALQGDPTHQESRAEGGPRGETLREVAWPAAPRGVKGEGEVGWKSEEGPGGGGRCGMQG